MEALLYWYWSIVVNVLNESKGTKPAASSTHNATYLLRDITGGSVPDYMQLPLEPQKDLYYFGGVNL